MEKIDLVAETAELLPARDTLFVLNWGNNSALVAAQNSSVALNLLTVGGAALSSAEQTIVVAQF